MLSTIKKLIQEGETYKAIKNCLALNVNKKNKNELTIISSWFNNLEKEYKIGIIEPVHRRIELNKITEAILSILSSIESELMDSPLDVYTEKKPMKIKDLEDSNRFKKLNKRINDLRYFKDRLFIRDGPTILLPNLIDAGKYQFNKQEINRAEEIEQWLKKNKRPNDACAAIISPPFWQDDPLYIGYYPMYYSEIKALREENKKVVMYSANGVIFCEEDRTLLLHRRSEASDDFKHTLHTFGGGLIPPGFGPHGDLSGIRECVVREIFEETGLSVDLSRETPTITIDEFYIDFIQTTFLGINIKKEQLLDLRPNWEGTIVKCKFDELEGLLKDINGWTPTGWIDVVYWLALNTPNSKENILFSGKTGNELANELLGFMED